MITRRRAKDNVYIEDKVGLSQKLLQAREKACLSQKRLAVEAGCSSATITSLERKRKEEISKKKLQNISDALGISLLSYIGDDAYTIKRKKALEYTIGQIIELENCDTCEVTKILERTVVVKDKFNEMRLLGKGEFSLIRQQTYERTGIWN